jgi:hypothetical protein
MLLNQTYPRLVELCVDRRQVEQQQSGRLVADERHMRLLAGLLDRSRS